MPLDAQQNPQLASQPSGRPPAAVEISPEGVLAAARPAARSRRARSEPARTMSTPSFPSPPARSFPASRSPTSARRKPSLLPSAPRSTKSRPARAPLPSSCPTLLVRVFVLDFDSLPAKPAEAISVLRFRLRKMVPFRCGACRRQLSGPSAEPRPSAKVLAAVIPGPILAEYESAVRAAGYEPGAVLPSSLAALESLDSMEAIMAANLSAHAITTTITNGQELLLYRTLDLPDELRQRVAEIQRSIAVAAAYFEDKLGSRPRRLHYAGVQDPADFAQSIADPALSVVEWASRPDEGA